MKIAWLSPLPPVRSGIAGYSVMILRELVRHAAVTVVVDQEELDPMLDFDVMQIDEYRKKRDGFDVVIAQVGNNLHHEFVWREAEENPSIIVLHELVLHHLLTEATLARGDSAQFERLMRESDGIAGEAFARGRAQGLHLENANFLFPGSAALASSAKRVIVHNRWARERLAEMGVRTPVTVVDHPFDELLTSADLPARKDLEKEHRFPPDSHLVGMFGFVTWPKRPEIVFEAFGNALQRDRRLRLLVVGEPAPNVDLADLARELGVPDDAWSATGWVSDAEFDAALGAVDRVVSLRYPSAGESSGAIVRVLAAGRPIAVSDYAQFADFPNDVVSKIPLGELEVPKLVEFMIERSDDSDRAVRQREWVRTHGDPARIAERYLEIASAVAAGEETAAGPEGEIVRSTLGLLPSLTIESFEVDRDGDWLVIALTARNDGDTAIRSVVWGTPAYRLIVKSFAGDVETGVDWWCLPGDLAPGRSVRLRGRLRTQEAESVALVHGWFDLPIVDEEPFFVQDVTA